MKIKSGLAALMCSTVLAGASVLLSEGAAHAQRFAAGDTADFLVSLEFSGNSVDFLNVLGAPPQEANVPGTGLVAIGTQGGFLDNSGVGSLVSITDLCQVEAATGEFCADSVGPFPPGATFSDINEDVVNGSGFIENFILAAGDYAIDLNPATAATAIDVGTNFTNFTTTSEGLVRDLFGGTSPVDAVLSFVVEIDNADILAAGFSPDNAANFLASGGNLDATVSIAVVPEPSTIIGSVLFGAAGVSLALKKRRNKKAAVS